MEEKGEIGSIFSSFRLFFFSFFFSPLFLAYRGGAAVGVDGAMLRTRTPLSPRSAPKPRGAEEGGGGGGAALSALNLR